MQGSRWCVVPLRSGNGQRPRKEDLDFSKGLSDETIANLNADNSNWAVSRDNGGVAYEWKNAKNLSGNLMANGVVIPEMNGLNFSTAGQKKGNDIQLSTTKLRLTRAGMKFNLPKLIGGQIVTIIAQSANGDATNRGFKFDDNMEWVSGPENGICLGANLPDGGRQELVWKVKESVTDSTEMTITLSPDGGLDIYMIMIDKGDGPQVEEAKKIAYIGDEADYAYSLFAGAPDRFDPKVIAGNAEDVDLDSLQKFEAVVISPALAADAKMVPVLKTQSLMTNCQP